jgi:GSH-dependent disulfide-bond oxidoreductase
MLHLYFWTTPNGYKVTILLEELGLGYNVVPVHIGKGEQFNPEFLKISPNNKIPALVDHETPDGKPIALFESGAIMMYLAEKSGWRFMPSDLRRRYDVVQWLMFQMGGIGPMLGQAHHFRRYAREQIPYAIERYTSEATRLYRVLDTRLGQSEYLAGEYSIADMAVYPRLRPYKWQGQDIAAWPNRSAGTGPCGRGQRCNAVSRCSRTGSNATRKNPLARAGTCCSGAASSARAEARMESYYLDRQ